jgi:hypothetical protein
MRCTAVDPRIERACQDGRLKVNKGHRPGVWYLLVAGLASLFLFNIHFSLPSLPQNVALDRASRRKFV